MRARVGLVAVVLVLASCSAEPGPRDDGPPSSLPSSGPVPAALRLTQPRAVHRATRLADGRVLITGGCTEPGCEGFEAGRRAEVFDGARGLVADATMATARASGTATLLQDGRVLLTGGYPGEGRAPTSSAEVYDPARGRFVAVGALGVARADHTATLLADGRVLVAGGFDAAGAALSSSEVFDPGSAEFAAGPDLSASRAAHVAVAVGDEVVLVGGTRAEGALGSTDVFARGSWSSGPQLLTPRVKLGVAAIGGDRVLVVGGSSDTEGRERLATTELLDIRRGTVGAGPELSTGEYKLDGALTTLADGRVVVASGDGLDVFDPTTNLITAVPAATYDARSFRTVTAVGATQVLVAGGYDDAISPTDRAVLVTVPRA